MLFSVKNTPWKPTTYVRIAPVTLSRYFAGLKMVDVKDVDSIARVPRTSTDRYLEHFPTLFPDLMF